VALLRGVPQKVKKKNSKQQHFGKERVGWGCGTKGNSQRGEKPTTLRKDFEKERTLKREAKKTQKQNPKKKKKKKNTLWETSGNTTKNGRSKKKPLWANVD